MSAPLKLPPGRTEAEALAIAAQWRAIVWKQPAKDEDERIERLTTICTRMCMSDRASGERLATRAIWS